MRPSISRTSAGLDPSPRIDVALAPDAFAQPAGVPAAPHGESPRPAPKPTPAPLPEAKPAAKTPGTEATVVNMKTIEGIMGKSVRSRAGNEDMGRISSTSWSTTAGRSAPP